MTPADSLKVVELVKKTAEHSSNKEFFDYIILFTSLIGAAAWLPWVFDRLKKTVIHLKPLSIYSLSGLEYIHLDSSKKVKVMGYFMKISISFLNKDAAIKKFKLFVKYPYDEKLHEAEVFYDKNFTYNPPKSEKYKINIPTTEFIQCKLFYEKDKQYITYLTFIVNGITDYQFDYARFEFYTQKNKTISYTLKKEDIDGNNLAIDLNDFIKIEPTLI